MGSAMIFLEVPLLLSYKDPERGGVFMWGTPRTRTYVLRDRGFCFSIHSLAFDPDMLYEFTLSELHPTGGQFLFLHPLWNHTLTYHIQTSTYFRVGSRVGNAFSIPALQVEPMSDDPWGHHVATAQATQTASVDSV
ncbi:hypothetical protein AHAS_Ahas14G0100800 [Arachis hypogaea]